MSKGEHKDEVNLDNVGSLKSHIFDDHRTGSSFGAYFNIVCTVAGTGTLALPHAVSQSGWISLLFFAITASVSIFTGRLLIECLYYKPDTRLQEFPDIGEAAFGKFGRYFTKVFHYSISLSSATIYILLTGSNIHKMLTMYNNGQTYMSEGMWIFIAGLVVSVPFILLKSLKEVAWLAAIGAISTLIVVFVVVIQGGIEFSNLNVAPETKPFVIKNIPTTLATIAFSYGGNVVYPHVEASMRHPKSWNKVLFYAVMSITVMYTIIGITGYTYYGEGVASPIMNSIKKGAGSIVAFISITAHVLLAAPIYLCSFALEQERWLRIDRNYMSTSKEFVCRAGIRAIIAGVMTGIAIILPFFSELTNVIGAISNSMIVFLIPITFHYKLFGWRGRSPQMYAASAIVVAIGLFGLFFSTYNTVKDLINAIKTGKSSASH